MGIIRAHIRLSTGLLALIFSFACFMGASSAQEQSGAFSLQVTPSPLVFTAKPGTTTTVDLKIRNTGQQPEELKIESKSFNLNQLTGEVTLNDEPPREAADWVSFADPTFTVQPGEWYTQKISFSPPRTAGFSYSFALQISRTQDPSTNEGERAIKGSVAVFTLINIDRPDATKKLEIVSFGTSKNVYEYLPVTISTTLRNTGNTILQPYGNIFIQRSLDDKEPIASLPFNEQRAYLLPDTTRTVENTWSDGFPVYTTSTKDGKESTSLSWSWGEIDQLRFGKYVAKLVAVYNDGSRDIPLQAMVEFWVIPWKVLLAAIVIGGVFIFGIWSIFGRLLRSIRGKSTKKRSKKPPKKNDDDDAGEIIHVRVQK